MMGDIGTGRREPHAAQLSVTLKLRHGALVGGMTALSLPAKRLATP